MLSSSIVPFLCVFFALGEEQEQEQEQKQKQERKMEKKLFVLAEKGSPIQNVMHVRPVGQALFGPTPSLPSYTVSIKSFVIHSALFPWFGFKGEDIFGLSSFLSKK